MPRLFCLVVLPALLMAGGKKTLDGGTAAPLRRPARVDAGTPAASRGNPRVDGGTSVDAGTPTAQTAGSQLDAGTSAVPPGSPRVDASTVDAGSIDAGAADAGCILPPGSTAESICWPREVQPVAKLDGSAVVAANAALQKLLARFPKEETRTCEYSPKAMEVVVGQAGGLYFVRINHRVEKCGWAAPGFHLETDWFELYAVSPDGRVLERYPYHP